MPHVNAITEFSDEDHYPRSQNSLVKISVFAFNQDYSPDNIDSELQFEILCNKSVKNHTTVENKVYSFKHWTV
jgi:hypothetical protein